MTWFDEEAIAQERFDADLEQAQFEAEGNAFARRLHRARALRRKGRFEKAAETCPHGGGYPLDSPAAEHENDPHAGEEGFRCSDCGSRLSSGVGEPDQQVLVACELDLAVA